MTLDPLDFHLIQLHQSYLLYIQITDSKIQQCFCYKSLVSLLIIPTNQETRFIFVS